VKLRIVDRDLDLAPTTRQELERRLRLALGRHAAGVAAARVTLAEAEPVRAIAEPAVRCRIRARLRRGESLVFEEQAPDARAALAAAAWRLAHRLDRPARIPRGRPVPAGRPRVELR